MKKKIVKKTAEKKVVKTTGKQKAFNKAMKLGKQMLEENKPRISKKLDKEISDLEKNPDFLKLIDGNDEPHPRLRVVIDNGCDVIFGNSTDGKLYALENHTGFYSLRWLNVPNTH